MARRQAGDGRWSAREAGAQARSQEQRREVAQQMRAYLEREGVHMPRPRTLWEAAAERLNRAPRPDENVQVALYTARPPGPATTVTVPANTTWASGGYTVRNPGWHNISFNWDPAPLRRMRTSLDEVQFAFERINAVARDTTQAVARPMPDCACGNRRDEFWEHSEEGCEFRPHQVELTHVD